MARATFNTANTARGLGFGAVAVALLVGASPPSEPRQDPAAKCDAWQIEYALAGSLTLRDTPHGSGDGTYSVGPGRAVLLFYGPDGTQVQLLGYAMRERFLIEPSAFIGS